MEKVNRSSNIELLRIISMLMIIGLHYFNAGMGGGLQYIGEEHYNYYIMYFLESACIVGVGTFVLITGYFQIEKDKINLRKIVNLLCLTIFYGVLFNIVLVIFNVNQFRFIELIRSIVPFLFGRRWFVITYIILYLLTPYLNIVLNNITKKQYKILILILILFFSIWPSFLPGAPNNDRGYGIISFVVLYSIGAYLKKYSIRNKSSINYFIKYIITTIVTTIFCIVINSEIGWGYNFIFNIVGSMYLFLAFYNLKIKSNVINYISKFTFSVFLIHSDFSLNKFLYNDILKTQLFWESPLFIVHFIISVLFIYFWSMVIDIVRIKLLNLIDKIDILNRGFNKCIEMINDKIF